MKNLEAELIADWQWVLKRSWSVRFMVIAALLSGAETVVPLLSDKIPHGPFAILSFLVTSAAFVARFVAQSRET
ncbi:hypothetical protein JQ617_08055 [Bradyrhizobium sp. KB893862 SZCCT0404]|uniref:DUF7940 domain-containing protein n=1 Tax=Bradyrhizobium sp. KB893862 SZCCT0404 TaxID=2807672 RepID=UPI001BA950AE|nr:hypothetical protein [Bradyrhizobium sp. KB893862 SZCCT0404]MBR1173903.1 hypothetical protein [Bradyrhizobium sp. KB893862 SZCCT0404]